MTSITSMLAQRHLLVVLIAFGMEVPQSLCQPPGEKVCVDSLTTLRQYLLVNQMKFDPPALQEHKHIRRICEQKGLARVVLDLENNDPLTALMSLISMKLQIELAVPRQVFWVFPPDEKHHIPGLAFPDDWSFPVDAWHGE